MRPLCPKRTGVLAVLALALSTSADAAVVELDRAGFQAALAGLDVAIDDLESYAPGAVASPFALANGLTYTADDPVIASAPDQQLFAGASILGQRVFSGFPSGATVFGVELFLQPTDDYDVVVTTVGGATLELLQQDGDRFGGTAGFFGVLVTGGDAIASVSFQATTTNGGGPGGGGGGVGNYSFDDVAIAGESLAQSGVGPGATVFTAGLLDFDDLGPSTLGVLVPNGYGGFTWGAGWHFLTTAATPDDTFLALAPTGVRVTNASIARADGQDFYFDGAAFWSRRAADARGDFYFVLYRDGVPVYDGRDDPDPSARNRFTDVPTVFTANYAGPIDLMTLAFDGAGDDFDHLAMDDFAFRAALPPPNVPLPAPALAVLAVMLAGAGRRELRAARRRGRVAAAQSGSRATPNACM